MMWITQHPNRKPWCLGHFSSFRASTRHRVCTCLTSYDSASSSESFFPGSWEDLCHKQTIGGKRISLYFSVIGLNYSCSRQTVHRDPRDKLERSEFYQGGRVHGQAGRKGVVRTCVCALEVRMTSRERIVNTLNSGSLLKSESTPHPYPPPFSSSLSLFLHHPDVHLLALLLR